MSAGRPPSPTFNRATPAYILDKLRVKPWVKAQPKPILLRNVNIINPSESSVLSNSQVLLKNGRIAAIGRESSMEEVLRSLDKGETPMTVDVKNMYLCPGLVDCHVHVTAVPGVKTMGEAMALPDQLVSLRSTYVLREMLARGFTTVRDTGGANAVLAEAIEEGLIPGPRLIQCGKALSQTGGHGDFRSASDSTQSCCGGHQRGLATTCDGIPQVLVTVRDEIRKGAKFIKVMCGGGVASPTDLLESLQFTAEEIQAITTTCRQMGNLPTTAHAYSVEAIRHAIDNGITGIEHGNFIDAPTARYMAEKGVFLTPTLSCYGVMVRPPFEDFLPDDGKKKNAEVMRSGLQAIQIAEQEGVTVCYGTDLLVSMHAFQTEEFAVRAQVLRSPVILRHATANAARMLRLEGKIGIICPGAYADLLILDANPLDDITILDKPEKHLFAVIKGGRVFRSRLEELPTEKESWLGE